MTASERRMCILNVLLEKRKDSLQRLSEEFQVSRWTIMRDIQELSRSHPISTKQGAGGGVRIMDGYRLGMKYLTAEQATLLEKLSENLTGEDLLIMQSILKTFSKPIQKIG